MFIKNTCTDKVVPCSSLFFTFLTVLLQQVLLSISGRHWNLVIDLGLPTYTQCSCTIIWTLYTCRMYKHKHEHNITTSFWLTSVELFSWTIYIIFTGKMTKNLTDVGLFPWSSYWKGADQNYIFWFWPIWLRNFLETYALMVRKNCLHFLWKIRLCCILSMKRYEDQEVTAHVTKAQFLLVPEKGSVSSAAENWQWIISIL